MEILRSQLNLKVKVLKYLVLIRCVKRFYRMNKNKHTSNRDMSLGCVSTCATTQLEACQYARRRSNDQAETCTSGRKEAESGRHALPCVYPLRTHFAHASPLAYCCPYACNQRMCHIACVVAQVETQPYTPFPGPQKVIYFSLVWTSWSCISCLGMQLIKKTPWF
jgi:hypothetical protein